MTTSAGSLRDLNVSKLSPKGAARVIGDVTNAGAVAYLRWHAADRDAVSDTRAFLTTTTARICLDTLKSARAARPM